MVDITVELELNERIREALNRLVTDDSERAYASAGLITREVLKTEERLPAQFRNYDSIKEIIERNKLGFDARTFGSVRGYSLRKNN